MALFNKNSDKKTGNDQHPFWIYKYDWKVSDCSHKVPAGIMKLADEVFAKKQADLDCEATGGRIFMSVPEVCQHTTVDYYENYESNTEVSVREGLNDDDPDMRKICFDMDFNPYAGPVPYCIYCQAAACPYAIAARKTYLLDNGLPPDDLSLADKPLRRDGEYGFNVKDYYFEALAGVADSVYEDAVYLADNGMVAISKKLGTDDDKKNFAYISLSFDYQGFKDGTETRSVRQVAESECRTTVYESYNLAPTKEMPLWEQTIVTAAVIHIARCTDRDLTPYEKIREQVLPEFRTLAAKVGGLDRILAIAQNDKTSSLRCTVEGDYEQGRESVINAIAGVLAKTGKTDTPEVLEVSFGQLAEEFSENYDSGESYESGNRKSHHKAYGGYVHRTFEKRKFYAVTGLDRYLSDRAAGKDTLEISQLGLEWLTKVLGMLEKQTYVCIVGYKDEIDKFLAIDSRFNFLYGSNRLVYPDMKPDDIFDMYYDGLSDKVTSVIKDKEAFKKEFTDYIAYNSRALPFDNDELAQYLSEYSNAEGKPILPPGVYDSGRVDKKLEKVVGMKDIKQQIRDFGNFIAFRKKAEAEGVKLPDTNMHMLFTGNPGTGKTMIARIISSMLYDIGLLREDKLVEVERKDLVAGYLGQTAGKTAAKIREALGGVLFIDEAYSLTGDQYGEEAIATLLKGMEDNRSNLVVIFAGYVDKMQAFVDSNPGLASRIGYKIHFDDYTAEELIKMLTMKADSAGMIISNEALDKARILVNYFCRQKNFGNGRFIDKLWQEMLIRHSSRENSILRIITEDDVPPIGALSTKHSSEKKETKLEDLIGLKQVKEQVARFRTRVAFENKGREFGVNLPRGNSHMLFIGPAGTGKTTVARILRDELYNAGIITERKITEVTAKDLIAEYVGQTSPRTQAVIDRAMGGILFIDESYQLATSGSNSFGQDAITTLIKAMEDCKDQFVVIFAGYEKEMKAFLDMNTGISSRIGYTFKFENYDADELTAIFRMKVEGAGLSIGEGSEEKVREIMQYFLSVPNFGNGRFAEKLSSIVYEIHAGNCADCYDGTRLTTVLPEDIPTIEHVISFMPDDSLILPSELTDKENERTAVHELGHALAAVTLFPDCSIEKITISAEGSGALGYVSNKGMLGATSTADELRRLIRVLVAGIASEQTMLGAYANGGGSDLEKATDIAWRMISSFGMSEYGLAVRTRRDERGDDELNAILNAEFAAACKLIGEHRDKLKEAKEYLLEKKTISEEEFKKIVIG